MRRKGRRVCRICDAKEGSLKAAGVPWLIECNKCGHWVCPLHVHFRKVRGASSYHVTCAPKCLLRKNKPKEVEPVQTGVNEWDYFHDREWNR